MSVKEIMVVLMSVSTHWEVMSVPADLDIGLVVMAKDVEVRMVIYHTGDSSACILSYHKILKHLCEHALMKYSNKSFCNNGCKTKFTIVEV